jgi:hypothetical protein
MPFRNQSLIVVGFVRLHASLLISFEVFELSIVILEDLRGISLVLFNIKDLVFDQSVFRLKFGDI